MKGMVRGQVDTQEPEAKAGGGSSAGERPSGAPVWSSVPHRSSARLRAREQVGKDSDCSPLSPRRHCPLLPPV